MKITFLSFNNDQQKLCRGLISKLLCCNILFLAITSQRSLKKWCYRGDLNSKQRFDCMCILKHSISCNVLPVYMLRCMYKYMCHMNFVIDLVRLRVFLAKWQGIGGRNPKVWGSIPHGDSEFFLCPTLVTRRKTSFFINK